MVTKKLLKQDRISRAILINVIIYNMNKNENKTKVDPQVARLIKKLSKKYAKVWQDLAKI